MDAVAAEMAPLMQPSTRMGAILSLEGNLGAGKTSLARALIRKLTNNPDLDVPSPTFTLLQTYDAGDTHIWHFDFYRLKHPEEVFELGWEDALASKGIIIMEWAERIGPLLPPMPIMRINITPQPDGTRFVELTL